MFSKTFVSLAVLATTLTLASAAPAPKLETRDAIVTATLFGAAGAQYTIEIPFTSTFYYTENDLSISHIETDGGPCWFEGVDGLCYTAEGAGYGDVGPPQTIVGVVCGQTAE